MLNREDLPTPPPTRRVIVHASFGYCRKDYQMLQCLKTAARAMALTLAIGSTPLLASSNEPEFKKAAEDVQTLSSRPSDDELLHLYGLYKQALSGDVSGAKPSILHFKERKKFEAWESQKGKTAEQARVEYIALVRSLMAR